MAANHADLERKVFVTMTTMPDLFISDLITALGDRVTVDQDVMLAYRRDHSLFTTAGTPMALVRARSADDVVACLTLASQHGVPVVTRGAGTGLAGAANGIGDGIVLSTEQMNEILSIDVASRTARVHPGAINADLAAAAADVGLWYVPDPGSRAISTIGGNIATNAGGSCCAKYGVTADHVAAITAVLADGRVIRTGANTRKNVAGLNLMQLLVGSEGTLATIVEATVRLRTAPVGTATIVASFLSTSQAISAVLDLQSRTDPCLVELMDRTTITAVNEMTKMGLDDTAGALPLIQYDGREAAAEAAVCVQSCTQTGATEVYDTCDPGEGEQFMAARRVAFTALERQGSTLLDDLAVPVIRLPQMLSAIESIADRYSLTIGTFGHAADGNLHPTIVFDAADCDAANRAQKAFGQLIAECLALGGSISGEHGIGLLKRPYLADQIGVVERELMLGIKSVFDPLGILNPGRGF